MSKITRRGFTLGVAIIGAMLCGIIFYTAPVPALNKQSDQVVAIHTQQAEAADFTPIYTGYGRLQSSEIITIRPQVAGEIVEVSTNFTEGDVLRQNQHLLKIDPQDYQAQVIKAQAQLAIAQADYQLERGQQLAAKRDYEIMIKQDRGHHTNEQRSLFLREPQLNTAKANLRLAKNELASAKRNLSRASLISNGRFVVLSKMVNVGDIVEQNQLLGQMANLEKLRVELAVPLSIATMMSVGQPVEIHDGPHQYQASVSAIAASLQQNSQLRLVYLTLDKVKQLPSALGAFVNAKIALPTIANAVKLPISALDKGKLWLVSTDNTLTSIIPNIAWQDQDWIYLSQVIDLPVVVSKVSGAHQGLAVQVVVD